MNAITAAGLVPQPTTAPAQPSKVDTLAHYTGQLAVTDPRLVQLVALFGLCDERGKRTILAIAGVQVNFARGGL